MKKLPQHYHQPRQMPKTKRAAFSLIEVLVAIAIVAALAVLLFSLSGVITESNRRTRCMMNLKQLGVMLSRFAYENRGEIPLYLDSRRPLTSAMWQQRLLGANITEKDTELFLCPSRTDRRVLADPSPSNYYYFFAAGGAMDYGLNNYLCQINDKRRRLNSIERPAKIVLVAERFNISSKSAYGLGRHGAGVNVLFVDGHCETIMATQNAGKLESKLDRDEYWDPTL